MPDSDYSDFGAEGDQDSDQLEMQVIYDQQQRNRNTGQVSEIKLMQVKAEIEDTPLIFCSICLLVCIFNIYFF